MRIAINTRHPFADHDPFRSDPIYASISRLAEKHPQDQFVYLFEGPFDSNLITSPGITGISVQAPAFFRAGYERRLAALMSSGKTNLLLNTRGICLMRASIPQILFLQDLVDIDHPRLLTRKQVIYYKKYMPRFLEKATMICTPSEYSKNIIAAKYKISTDKIKVLYPVAGALFSPLDEKSKERVKEKYAGGREYYLFSGSIEPRNDLIGLLKAFSLFKKRQKTNMLLLLVGKVGRGYEELAVKLKTFKFRSEVKLLEPLSPPDLAAITAAAYGFLYPSLYDGQAIALLEAMQCGVPLIAYAAGAIPEICGEAAIYAETGNVTDLAEKMMVLFKDENGQKELIRKGQLRSAQFHSGISDDLLWQSIMQCSLP